MGFYQKPLCGKLLDGGPQVGKNQEFNIRGPCNPTFARLILRSHGSNGHGSKGQHGSKGYCSKGYGSKGHGSKSVIES